MRIFIGLNALALVLMPSVVFSQDMAKPAIAPVSAPTALPGTPTVADKVSAEWPKYDKSGKGHLTKAELSSWLSDLRKANGESPPDANWLAAAFTQTDTNSDKRVSPEELTASLSSSR
jgi:hypothetical protein